MWTFFCYDDGSATNLWDGWYAGRDQATQVRHNMALKHLESNRVELWRGVHYFRMLKGGMGEIRIKGGDLEWRLVGFFGAGHQFTVVMACYHKQQVYTPRDALKTAQKRMKEILKDPSKRKRCVRPGRA